MSLLYRSILLGWHYSSDYSSISISLSNNQYKKDSSYIWAFPISFDIQKSSIKHSIFYVYLNLNMINRKNDAYPSAWEGEEYHKLMDKYVYSTNNKNSYIYGYEILDTYFRAQCVHCEL